MLFLLIAEATFNIRFNNKHSSSSIKKKLNKIFKRINKKYKSKFVIDYRVSGEAFLTKPDKTTYMIQNILKKLPKLNQNYLLLVEHQIYDLLKNISRFRIWISRKNYAQIR